jgi:hypothetical protein
MIRARQASELSAADRRQPVPGGQDRSLTAGAASEAVRARIDATWNPRYADAARDAHHGRPECFQEEQPLAAAESRRRSTGNRRSRGISPSRPLPSHGRRMDRLPAQDTPVSQIEGLGLAPMEVRFLSKCGASWRRRSSDRTVAPGRRLASVPDRHQRCGGAPVLQRRAPLALLPVELLLAGGPLSVAEAV